MAQLVDIELKWDLLRGSARYIIAEIAQLPQLDHSVYGLSLLRIASDLLRVAF